MTDLQNIVESTVVKGKTVGEWAKIIEDYENVAISSCTSSLKIVDLTCFGEELRAVRKWEARGKPSEKSEAVKKAKALIEKADDLIKFASMDDDKARELEALGGLKSIKKADKLKEASKKKKEQAEALRNEARTIAGG